MIPLLYTFNEFGHHLDSLNVDIVLTRSSVHVTLSNEEKSYHVLIDYHALSVHHGLFQYSTHNWLPLLFLSPSHTLQSMIIVVPILSRLVAFVAHDGTRLPY
ncbi:hypothetical protein M9H77_13232 [Catharanthus roseus]|uniref:Uncharacterized protein n=1 Tax=Catharanthus roseus TaxID=4058 RepID=A0ACC0BJS9_CATRO|nr:hypothetical protein M9H77_13232 [Catharanthus roseus]